jgi:hypothetical protein
MDAVVFFTLDKWEIVSGRFGGDLTALIDS